MTTPTLTLAEVFDQAADVIERNGWTQGGWWDDIPDVPDDECRVCMGGAVNIVIDGGPDIRPAHQSLPGVLWDAYEVLASSTGLAMAVDLEDCEAADVFDAYVVTIGRWNDDEARTAGEVIAKLRTLAEEMREQGR